MHRRVVERLGWMLSGALVCAFLLMSCSVVEEAARETPAEAAGQPRATRQREQVDRDLPPDAPQSSSNTRPSVQGDPLADTINAVFENNEASVVLIQTNGGLGTGFVIDRQGHIVTNYHVVQGSQQVRVNFTEQEDAIGDVIGTDPDSDLAVVRVRDFDQGLLVPVEMGDSSNLRVGQLAIAIGNPLGEERTVTAGIISALRAAKKEGGENLFSIPGIIQTDAPINPGNSGGPLFDAEGRVIGVNTFIIDPSGRGANVGLGYAVPINLVKKVVPDLIETGSYQHPYLGVNMDTVTRLEAQNEGLPDKGAIIRDTSPGDPADRGGIQPGDIVKEINGTPIGTHDDVISYLEFNTEPGDVVTFTVVDPSGDVRDVEVELGARESR